MNSATIIQQAINQENRQNRLSSRNTINTIQQYVDNERWLSNYRLEIGSPIPAVESVRNIRTIDASGIDNLNQNQQIADRFITTAQNNTREIVVNPKTTQLSDNYIDQSQELINLN